MGKMYGAATMVEGTTAMSAYERRHKTSEKRGTSISVSKVREQIRALELSIGILEGESSNADAVRLGVPHASQLAPTGGRAILLPLVFCGPQPTTGGGRAILLLHNYVDHPPHERSARDAPRLHDD